MTRREVVEFLLTRPVDFARAVGFSKLKEINNTWMLDMLTGKDDRTLQAHRSSYKTTCVSVVLAIIMLLLPNLRTLFMRKTATNTEDIIRQVRNILLHRITQALCQIIYGVPLVLTVDRATELSTSLANDVKGTSQLVGMGIDGAITGKHFDLIFTDDIVDRHDRYSRAERERTKEVYAELQNVRNVDGRIFNTGTPWHHDDCFSVMPNIVRWTCYDTGILSAAEIEAIRNSESMTPSLFAANYELRHIASDGQLFKTAPIFTRERELACNGICQIDAAYGGEDSTCATIGNIYEGTPYALGKMWRQRHVDECVDEIVALCKRYRVGLIICETNRDAGFLAAKFQEKGIRALGYHETMNKYYKISTYLQARWKQFVWLEGTDKDYLEEIMDYTDTAEHDDAPDSAASFIRYFDK